MGNKPSTNAFQYAVPFDETPAYPDSTPAYRAAVYPTELVDSIPGYKWDNQWEIFQYRLAQPGYRQMQFLGSRLWNSEDGYSSRQVPSDEIEWLTYEEFERLVIKLARGIRVKGLVRVVEYPNEPFVGARRFKPIGILSRNRPEWFILDYAAAADNLTLVPLYDSLSKESFTPILSETQMDTLVVTKESVGVILDAIRSQASQTLKNLISFDPLNPEVIGEAEALGLSVHFWLDLVKVGAEAEGLPLNRQTGDDINAICYTSGTTGSPKGTIIASKNIVASICGHQRGILTVPCLRALGKNDIHISYLPLAHIFERALCLDYIIVGCRIVCFSGDVQKLLEDMRVIKPTIFLAVPRLFFRINDKITTGLAQKSAVAQFLFNTAMNAKLTNLQEKGMTKHYLWDTLVFNKVKKMLGGEIKYMLVGGAPLESYIQHRISVLFCCPILHGFGMTEIGAAFLSDPSDKVAGHIGAIQPSIEFCLRSIPEMNYSVQSSPPCGELLIRGPSVTPGYLLNEAATKELFTAHGGWLQTGDVALLLPGNSLKIIDRKKNIFKLSQGEYVAPEKIEGVYCRSPIVSQIFVHGESTEAYLVAIVVPDEEFVTKFMHDHGHSDREAALADARLKTQILQSMDEAVHGDLKGFEKVKAIHIFCPGFTHENGLVTPTLKIKRHYAKQFFEKEIHLLYNQKS